MSTQGPSGWRSGDDVAGDLVQTVRWRLRSILRPFARPVARSVMGAVPFNWLLKARAHYATRIERGESPKRIPFVVRASRFRLVPPSVADYSPPGRPDLRFSNASSSVVQTTFWFGMDPGGASVEGAQLKLWEELCAAASEIVEIGANVGSLTVPGARATRAPYRAVEPHPETTAVLRRNVELNDLRHVEVVEAAAVVERDRDYVELALPADDPWPTSTAAAVVLESEGRSQRGFRVPAVPVTDLVGDADLVKLDVEGMELPLLSALEPFVLRRRPTMMVEVLDHNRALKSWLAEFVVRNSMDIHAITASGLHRVLPGELPGTSLSRRYGTRDVLVVPRSR